MSYIPKIWVLPPTKVVKWLIIANVIIWIFVQVLIGRFVYPDLNLRGILDLCQVCFFQNFTFGSQ